MQLDTNHLKVFAGDEDVPAEYEILPDRLHRAARRKLNGRKEATVSKNSGGKLSRWAAEQRKAKRKIARKARRANAGRR